MNFEKESQVTLHRLLPRLEPLLPEGDERTIFYARLEEYFPTVFRLLV